MNIIINSGHWSGDSGATYSAVKESDISMEIRNKIGEYFPSAHYVPDNLNLTESIKWANEKKPDLAIGIHVNSVSNDKVRGVECYYGDDYHEAQKLASMLSTATRMPNGGARHQSTSAVKSLAWINQVEAPVTLLVECGYLSNWSDRTFLLSPIGQKKIAKSIVSFVKKYERARYLSEKFNVSYEWILRVI